jgi:hypothetical protein
MAEFVKEGSLFVVNENPGPASQGGCFIWGDCFGICEQYKYRGYGILMVSYRNCIHFDSPPPAEEKT